MRLSKKSFTCLGQGLKRPQYKTNETIFTLLKKGQRDA